MPVEWQLSQCTCKESRGAFRSVLRRTADGGRVTSGEGRGRGGGHVHGPLAEATCWGGRGSKGGGSVFGGSGFEAKWRTWNLSTGEATAPCGGEVAGPGRLRGGHCAGDPETGRAPRALQSGRHRPRPDRGEPLFSTALQTEMLTISTSLTVLKRHIPACLRNGY